MSTTGSCFCGNLKYEYSGEPAMKANCHCHECRKISGSSHTVNLLVPEEKFSITAGTPKTFSRKHESGMDLTVFFCPDCGSAIKKAATLDAFRGMVIVQAGTLDGADGMEAAGPAAELYVKYRASWMPEITGAGQMQEFV